MAGLKILYIEDDVFFATGNMDKVRALPLDIEFVLGFNQAQAETALATQGPFDLIVSDLHYPDLSGGNDGGAHLYVKQRRAGDLTPIAFHSSDFRHARQYIAALDPALARDLPEDMIFDKSVEFPSVIAAALKRFAPEIAQALTTRPRLPPRPS